MRRMVAWACWCIAFGLTGCTAQPSPTTPPMKYRVGMLRVDQVGWRQMGQADPEAVANAVRAGLNTFVLVYPAAPSAELATNRNWFSDSSLIEPYGKAVQLIKQIGTRETGVAPQVWAWTRTSVSADTAAGEARSMTSSGASGTAVCPIDSAFWSEQVLPKGLALVKLGFDAVLFETEVYDKDGVRLMRGDHCYCVQCLTRFLRGRNRADALPAPPARLAWLDKNGLRADFEAWQEKTLLDYARTYRDVLAKAKPNIRLGYYIGPTLANNWYLRALSQGLARPGSPLINMDQGTYSGQGMSYEGPPGRTTLWDWHRFQKGLFAQWNVEAEVIHGIWTDYAFADFGPLDVERFCFINEVIGDGYWIYNQLRDPAFMLQPIKSASTKAQSALRSPSGFTQTVTSMIGVREQEGYDTRHSQELLKRAQAAGEDPMAAIWAYQADWLLRR